MNLDELAAEIKKTKNYRSLYPSLIDRVCAEEFQKYRKDKEKVKAVKNRLHVIYGAFAADFSKNIKNTKNIKNISITENADEADEKEILKLHASANERLPYANEFYRFIFDNIENTGEINSVLDVGCGFNPFFLPVIRQGLPELKYYYALDIDAGLTETLNLYFKRRGFPELAGCIDVISENPVQKADIAFLFKIIPTVENCKKGRGFELIEQIFSNCAAKYIVVTFPVKTLCGKNKGMAENYAAFFKKNIKNIQNINDGNDCKFAVTAENIIGGELIYILMNLSLSLSHSEADFHTP